LYFKSLPLLADWIRLQKEPNQERKATFQASKGDDARKMIEITKEMRG